MKKFFIRRVMPVFMAVVMSFSVCVVPSKAVALETIASIIELIGAANDIKRFAEDVFSFFNGTDPEDWGTWWCTTQYISTRDHAFYTYQTLSDLCFDWNQNYQQQYYSIEAVITELGFKGYKYVVLQPKNGIQNENYRRVVLTHPDGTIIAYDPALDEDPVEPEVPGADSYGRWISEEAFEKSEKKRMLSMEELTNLANDVGADLAWNDMYYYIYRDDGCLVYADSSGRPYAAFRDPDAYASQTERPGTTVEGDEEVDEGFDAKIDLENGVINLPDGTLAFLDAVIYDESTKSYYFDSHDVTNNYYYYHYEYHINYTSITYIGQTEEYNKYYEVYYELPDGRDSADLTKEDLEQLNLSIDVIPYGRSTDNTSLRSLYHFDGDTRDSSYWNYCTDFVWNEGASLTYMEAGTFEGALYLDETEHEFTLQLPSDIGSGDFTLQYRIYQSHTAAPVTDSYISFGSVPLLQWSGGYWLDPDDTALHVTPTGTWNEVALIRDSGTVYYYLNGVCMGSYASTAALNDHITFFFGDEQQTFKHLDELRVLDFAMVEGGASYAPTAVPHDTNLALVVPTDAVPVADEYWSIIPSEGALAAYDFSSGELPEGFSSNYTSYTDYKNMYGIGSRYLDVEVYSNYTRFANLDGYAPDFDYDRTYSMIMVPVGWKNAYNSYGSVGKTLTISVVLSDGSLYSYSGRVGSCTSTSIPNGVIGFDYAYPSEGSPTVSVAYVGVNKNKSMDILYIEVVEGTSSNISAEWVESITPIDKDNLHTPTLAVRTDLEITSHQIGGVRPSVPEKGMVWALVENQRITSLQIYNGQAWEGVDGRMWTGTRWIPARSYNVITLQDMYDIVDATQDFEYIYSESGFWTWWQKSWNAFTEKLFSVLGSGGSGGSTAPSTVKDAVANALSSLIEGVFGVITEVLKAIIGAVTDILSGIFGFFTDTVFGGIKDFFGSFDGLTDPFESTTESGEGSVALPEGVAGGFSFISGVFGCIPAPVQGVLIFGIAALVLLSVLVIVL